MCFTDFLQVPTGLKEYDFAIYIIDCEFNSKAWEWLYYWKHASAMSMTPLKSRAHRIS